jgi:hypothetical protein
MHNTSLQWTLDPTARALPHAVAASSAAEL